LPELFCGFDRRKGEGPTAYPVACSPQAWSVGAVFMMLDACLRMEINAPERKIYFRRPILPDFIDNLLISNLRIDNEYISVELHRYKEETGIVLKNLPPDWEWMMIK
jgi:glycogen debranching enzyme